jgi:16S rRNA (uracil1498-N3)-methyltransferase
MPRFYCTGPLAPGQSLDLPPGAARHVQVLRMQPGADITLFNGSGGEFEATIEHMGRRDVRVRVGAHQPIERELTQAVHLAVGVPANERMDWLVEKAVELGAASIQPLIAERSVLKPTGERAEKKRAHWQAIAQAACEQCGRNRVPPVHDIADLRGWLAGPHTTSARWLLAPDAAPSAIQKFAGNGQPAVVLSGPEGGLTAAERELAQNCGFTPVGLGPRVLRAETAPLVLLAALTLPS